MHNMEINDKIEDVGRGMPTNYVVLDNKQDEQTTNMFETEGKLHNQPNVILIDYGASHSNIF